jgi:putative transposase
MPNYRHAWHAGGTYFFTVNLLQRNENDLLVRHIDYLRDAIRTTKKTHPFVIHGWVVLPDHMHCVISLPDGDADFVLRWHLIKARFSKSIPDSGWRSEARQRRGERGFGNDAIGSI